MTAKQAKKISNKALIIAGSALVLAGYQNCSKIKVADQGQNVAGLSVPSAPANGSSDIVIATDQQNNDLVPIVIEHPAVPAAVPSAPQSAPAVTQSSDPSPTPMPEVVASPTPAQPVAQPSIPVAPTSSPTRDVAASDPMPPADVPKTESQMVTHVVKKTCSEDEISRRDADDDEIADDCEEEQMHCGYRKSDFENAINVDQFKGADIELNYESAGKTLIYSEAGKGALKILNTKASNGKFVVCHVEIEHVKGKKGEVETRECEARDKSEFEGALNGEVKAQAKVEEIKEVKEITAKSAESDSKEIAISKEIEAVEVKEKAVESDSKEIAKFKEVEAVEVKDKVQPEKEHASKQEVRAPAQDDSAADDKIKASAASKAKSVSKSKAKSKKSETDESEKE